jgi:hypothetical protein
LFHFETAAGFFDFRATPTEKRLAAL